MGINDDNSSVFLILASVEDNTHLNFKRIFVNKFLLSGNGKRKNSKFAGKFGAHFY